ncbi:5-methylphenazine-1-carboxylate 1-monooxygenase [Bienertia sinuspersici]
MSGTLKGCYFNQNGYNNLFEKLLNKLSGSILVLGSRMLDANTEYEQADEHLTKLFPYNIDIRPPQDETNLVNWNSQLEEDMKMIQFQDTRNHIAEVLAANDLAKQTTKSNTTTISSINKANKTPAAMIHVL